MVNLTNENLLTLIFTSFTLKANNNIMLGIKNKTISKAILVLTLQITKRFLSRLNWIL
jgi:hypothetical protein